MKAQEDEHAVRETGINLSWKNKNRKLNCYMKYIEMGRGAVQCLLLG